MANVSKADLIKELTESTGVSREDVKVVVEGMLASVGTHLKQGDKVQLPGFGTFEVRERAARTGVKPRTGEKIEIPASKGAAFKAGKGLKDQIA